MAPPLYRAMMSTTALLVAAVAGSPIDDSALGLCEVAWHTEPSHVSCIQFAQACTMQHTAELWATGHWQREPLQWCCSNALIIRNTTVKPRHVQGLCPAAWPVVGLSKAMCV
jgi:hypothetical protein